MSQENKGGIYSCVGDDKRTGKDRKENNARKLDEVNVRKRAQATGLDSDTMHVK